MSAKSKQPNSRTRHFVMRLEDVTDKGRWGTQLDCHCRAQIFVPAEGPLLDCRPAPNGFCSRLYEAALAEKARLRRGA